MSKCSYGSLDWQNRNVNPIRKKKLNQQDIDANILYTIRLFDDGRISLNEAEKRIDQLENQIVN